MFLKLGFLFSTKAVMPYAGPSLLNKPWKIDDSCSSPCYKVVSIDTFIAFFAAYNEHEARLSSTWSSLSS